MENQEVLKNNGLSLLENIDRIVIGIRTTLGHDKSEEIFVYYDEIRANFKSGNIHLLMCFNRGDLLIKGLDSINLDNETKAYFYSLRAFLKQHLASRGIPEVKGSVDKIIYLGS